MTIKGGTEIPPLNYIICTDGNTITEEGESFLFDTATCFDYEPLVNGRYAVRFAAEDLYTNVIFSDLIVFDFEDGEKTYYADEDIPLIDTNSLTAAEAASDGEIHTAQLNIINNTSADIVELYIATEQDDTWGDECLISLSPLEAGKDLAEADWCINYSADSLVWDIKVVDQDGNEHIFGWDLSDCNSEAMSIEFTDEDDGQWSITY